MLPDSKITPTGYNVLIAMTYRRDELGIVQSTKHELADRFEANPRTVLLVLQDFENRGWVEADYTIDRETHRQCPTQFRLTPEAPSLSDLLG